MYRICQYVCVRWTEKVKTPPKINNTCKCRFSSTHQVTLPRPQMHVSLVSRPLCVRCVNLKLPVNIWNRLVCCKLFVVVCVLFVVQSIHSLSVFATDMLSNPAVTRAAQVFGRTDVCVSRGPSAYANVLVCV